MKKSISILFYLSLFLLLSSSSSLNPLNIKDELAEFNRIEHEEKQENKYSNFNINLSAYKNIKLSIQSSNTTLKVGEKGIIYFVTNYNDTETNIFDISDIEQKTKFNTTIHDENQNEYNVNCKLWKPIHHYIRIICNLEDKLKNIENNITLNSVQIIYKEEYNIEINQEEFIKIKQLNYSIPFLYSNQQSIEIKDNLELYELKFKYESYNNEVLIIYGESYNYAALDNCKINDTELKCEVSKNKFEEILIKNNEIFKIKIINDNVGLINMDFVLNITINYLINKKIDIYIGITRSLCDVAVVNSPYAFETNVTDIPNIISGLNDTYFFKKTKGNPLLLLCFPIDDYYFEVKEELIWSNIHYKYNFRIQPFEESYYVFVRIYDYGSILNLIYPETLNFKSSDSIIIRYIMPEPYLAEKIRINIYEDLECENLNEMKKCIVPLSHFRGKQSGYYNNYQMFDFSNDLFKFNEISPIYIEKLIDNDIAINIIPEYNQKTINIGDKGTFYYVTDYNDDKNNIFNSIDIEEKTAYQTFFINPETSDNYTITCRLWKPIHENLRLFCKLEESLPNNENYNVRINNFNITFGKYNIFINFYLKWFQIYQLKYYPFLYSEEQIINIEDEKELYNLTFNIISYDNEVLYIGGKSINTKMLDKCKVNEKKLICDIAKEDLIGILQINGGNLFLYYYSFSYNYYDNNQYPNVFNITVNIKNLQKEDIYIGINKLLDNNLKQGNFVPFETNATNTQNLITELFQCKLGNNEYTCFIKKDTDNPLLFLCTGFQGGKYSLSELINDEIILDNINAKYNFRIQPTNNTEEFEINDYGGYISLAIPQKFDFTIKDEYKIHFIYKSHSYSHSDITLKLDPYLEDMNCGDSVTCTINYDYFENKKNGSYNLYFKKDYNSYSRSYEAPPIEVILPRKNTINIKIKEVYNKDRIPFGKKGILYFITNYNDNERNIFDVSDIEEKTKFETMIYDNIRSNLISCRLWKPNNDNLRIICKLDNYDLTSNMFMAEKVSLYYNKYIINISFKNMLYINRNNYDIPFLYSDTQIIEIKDDIETYNLKFKTEIYNNEQLYLYGEVYNSIILDNCQKKGNELNCKLTKQKLEEVLVKNNEQFRIEAINNNIGLIKFINVLNITINYEIKQKKDIYIGINGSLADFAREGVSFGFTTNVTKISNIISDINNNCYFKKINDNPLLYLCRYDEAPKDVFQFGNITNEFVLDNLHYKYNFRIQPFKDIFTVNIYGYGKNVKHILTEFLDFTSEDNLIISFIMPSPYQLTDIWLNPSSSSLECEDLVELKQCKIPLSHFVNEKSGYFYLHYSNNERYYDLSPIKVILPNSFIEIPIEYEDNAEFISIGDKGLLYLKTNYSDNETNIFDANDIEEETTFVTTLKYDFVAYSTDVKCRLWKPLNEKLWLFCKLNISLRRDIDNVKLKDAVFHYKNHAIAVVFHCSPYQYFKLKTINARVPFLYSERQRIDIKEEIDSYDLKFHIGIYNEQPLCLSLDEAKKIILQDCKEDGKDLICNIKKEKFYEVFTYSNQKIKLYPCDYLLKDIEFKAVSDININFDNIQKEDIFINITKLLDNNIDTNTYIAYETNVTNISDIISETFMLSFRGFSQTYFTCRIKKSIKTSLLIVCQIINSGTFYLEEIMGEKILNNINAKYNFRIQPLHIRDKFEVDDAGIYIKSIYPLTLNYYLYDTINIDIDVDRSWSNGLIPEIKLNPDSDRLNCYELEYKKERCIVPKTHFEGKEDGYFYIQYTNYFDNITIFHQLSPFQVILPKKNDIIIRIKKEDNKDIIKIGQKGILYLITDFIDKTYIFSDSFIPFNSIIKDDNDNKYNINCKLWIPKNEKLRIICKLNENLLYNQQNISLNKVEFIYNNYNIFIFQQDLLEIEQLNYDISFLYSDKQNIEIKEGKESYNMIFYIENYNDEPLYLYGERKNFIILDNCDKNEKELNCKISKEKLEEVLILKNEQFKIGAINDTIGILNFDSILNITINYEIDKKEDIYVEIIDIFSSNGLQGVPIAFKTNVTDIPNINSDILNLCYFKKNKYSPLLYLCNFYVYTPSYKIDNTIFMNNSHYKYNFIILPSDKTYYLHIYNTGKSFNFVFPEILNFTSEESLTIKYLISDASLTDNIKYISDSDYLKCEYINGLKRCIVPFTHFIRQKSGYYYLNQINVEESFIHYESSPINVILPENIIEIYVNDEDNQDYKIIGKNNILSFVTNYTDERNIFNIDDIEEKTHFNTTISLNQYNDGIYFKVTCRLWKPKNDKIRLLCKLNESIGINFIKINNALFSYKEYKIAIISTMSYQTQGVKTSRNIPFIYSDKQEINIEENKQFYELKFKFEEYNNDVLYLQRKVFKYDPYLSEFIFDNCTINGKDLTCIIEKEKIIEYLQYNGEIFELNFYFYLVGPYKLSNVLDIKINYNIDKKEDIFVGITKLLQNNLYSQNYIPYETNITSITNVNSNFFDYFTSVDNYYCKMKKTKDKPLLFLCFLKMFEEKSSLGENNTEVILDNIHIKYNFRIQPVNNTEEFTMKDEGSRILLIHPTKLDFSKNDLIPIYFYMLRPENTKGIRLNPNSEELECAHQDNLIKRCLVPKSHFNESGYYYTHYLNDNNGLNIFYDISPIFINRPDEPETDEPKTDEPKTDVPKPEDSRNKNLAGIIVGSVIGGLVIIGLIAFLVIRHYRKKNATVDGFSGKNENTLLVSTKDEGEYNN